MKTHQELELTDQSAVYRFLESERPEYVFLAAAKVGGILANKSYPAQFIYSNLQIQTTVIHACHIYEVKKEYGNILYLLILSNHSTTKRLLASTLSSNDHKK